MGDILIIGAGFAGLEAAHYFAKNRSKMGFRQVILIDVKATSDFLPILPDVAGGCVSAENAAVGLDAYLGKLKINFQQDEVIEVDIKQKEVLLKSGRSLSYEYLLLAPGVAAHYDGFQDLKRKAFELKTVEDASRLMKVLEDDPNKTVLVVGGGYTGVEIAASLAFFLKRRGFRKNNIHLIEKGEDILGSLPLWVQEYCRMSLCAHRVSIHCSSSIKEATDEYVRLSNGIELRNYLFVWVAGVIAPSFTGSLDAKRDTQGRLFVDEHMGIGNGCYAAGDLACFQHRGKTLRMAAQFSIAEAQVAAKNILRSIIGKKLLKYRPCDFGFLVPLANRKACGKVLFFRVSGLIGWFLHYCICILHSFTLKNRIGLFGDIFLKGRR